MERGMDMESSAVAMEWRAVGETVPVTLSEVSDSVSKSIDYMSEACGALRTCINTIDGMAGGIVGPPPAIGTPNPVKQMAYAFREVAHHHAMNGLAVRVFSLYGEHLGLVQAARLKDSERHFGLLEADPSTLWRVWVTSEVGRELPWTLSYALSFHFASMDAIHMAFRWSPGESPPWSAWRTASEELARLAELEALISRDEEQLRRNAIALEFMDASKILRKN